MVMSYVRRLVNIWRMLASKASMCSRIGGGGWCVKSTEDWDTRGPVSVILRSWR
jgi:hypothetical protein